MSITDSACVAYCAELCTFVTMFHTMFKPRETQDFAKGNIAFHLSTVAITSGTESEGRRKETQENMNVNKNVRTLP